MGSTGDEKRGAGKRKREGCSWGSAVALGMRLGDWMGAERAKRKSEGGLHDFFTCRIRRRTLPTSKHWYWSTNKVFIILELESKVSLS